MFFFFKQCTVLINVTYSMSTYCCWSAGIQHHWPVYIMYGTFCALEQFAIESLRHRERYARKRYMMGAFCDGSIITMERFVLQTIRERYHADVGRLREHFLSASMWPIFLHFLWCVLLFCTMIIQKATENIPRKIETFPLPRGIF